MDTDVSRWLLDFLVRQPISDSNLTSLLSSLPLSDTDSNLKKLLLLRKLDSQISTPTQHLLLLLEQIEELDHRENVTTVESMKRAYCAVAVHCTFETECFEQAVKSIWSVRVGGMVRFGNVGLLCDELIRWKGDFETALSDSDVKKGLEEKWKAGVAVGDVLRGFVREAKEMMPPAFLELVAQAAVQDDGALRQLLGMEDTRQDIQMETVHRRSKVRAAKQYKRSTPRTSSGVKIVDNDDLAESDASPHKDYGCLSTPEVAELQENLRSSTLELQEMVKDPLPEAIAEAKNVASKLDCVDRRSDVIPAENSNLENKGSTHQTNATKASLMEQNKTAVTYEWDELSDGSADRESRPHFSSHKKEPVTLEKHENPKPIRRKRKVWSNLEEDTLRAGVQKYGIGNWKLILNMYKDIFDERTEVDLKDKWRNMTS
ncbi:hypothetical protein DCAR_0520465 [Daucus carota subsp. sativus]|uniref:Uncharacterized protein n=1 Tax=Daucus carota subsp. sativus TaxID=79200 RepID=A0A164YJP6_DAUCS|nr:PREDICTED: uncharacterized protein LOC108219813 [Daucus carota subsp. sativus]WOH01086.1 hypothetical protein DCAR_0520465 [Daucus carota subsp. sativus]